MQRPAHWCAGGALFLLVQCSPLVLGQDDSLCPGVSLKTYIGAYAAVELLQDVRVAGPLADLLGSELAHFKRNLEVAGPIDLISGQLSLSGNASHQGGLEEAVLCISLRDSTVSAALFSKSVIGIYANLDHYDQVSRCIKDWITSVNVSHSARLSMPENVVVHSQASEKLP